LLITINDQLFGLLLVACRRGESNHADNRPSRLGPGPGLEVVGQFLRNKASRSVWFYIYYTVKSCNYISRLRSNGLTSTYTGTIRSSHRSKARINN
jgi:hypothetical protein